MAEPLPRWDSADASALLPFGRVRLVAADLDGTLVSEGISRIYAKIENLRKSLAHHRYDVQMTIATGRTYAGARSLVDGVALPAAVPIVLYNGSVVVAAGTGHALLRREISTRSLIRVMEACAAAQACCLGYFFSPRALGPNQESVIGWVRQPLYELESNGMTVTWNVEPPNDHGPSAVLIDLQENPNATSALLRDLRGVSDVSMTVSGRRYIELRPAGSNKAVALQLVANALHVSREEVVALGDNDNDAEMLIWAGIGVAVSSASPLALTAADFQCSHGVAQGAIELLRLIRESKRYFAQYRRRKVQ